MIQSRAWYFVKRYGFEYEELESQGLLIYVSCINSYDITKASFSTFLYQNLTGRLSDYCQEKLAKERKDVHVSGTDLFDGIDCVQLKYDKQSNMFIASGFDAFEARKLNPSCEQFLEYAKTVISKECFDVLKWIFDNRLEGFRLRNGSPSLQVISKILNIKLSKFKIIWQELADFWNIQGAFFYQS